VVESQAPTGGGVDRSLKDIRMGEKTVGVIVKTRCRHAPDRRVYWGEGQKEGEKKSGKKPKGLQKKNQTRQ